MQIKPLRRTIGETYELTYSLFKQGNSLEQIAKNRNLTISTISAHLERLIKEGRDIDINKLVAQEKQELIQELFYSLKTWNTTPIVEYFNGTVSYEEARFVRATLQKIDTNKE